VPRPRVEAAFLNASGCSTIDLHEDPIDIRGACRGQKHRERRYFLGLARTPQGIVAHPLSLDLSRRLAMFRRYACHHRVPPFRANRARINAIDQDIATLPFKPSSMALCPFLDGVRSALSEARAVNAVAAV
jgi:hypothetical protein